MKRYTVIGPDALEQDNGTWVKHSEAEAAIAAAVKAEREKSAATFETFAQAIRHQCRGRIGEIVASMALDYAAAIRTTP